MSGVRIAPVPRERRHTLRFLDEIRSMAPVFLDTEVDMGAVLEHRAAARQRGQRYSTLSYVLYLAARVLANHPDANAAIRGRIRPAVAHYPAVSGKITLDKTLNGHRIVLSTVLPDLARQPLDAIQRDIARFRTGDPATMPEFAAARVLQRLPWPLAPILFRMGIRPLRRRSLVMGTFAVTSLAHRPVDGLYSVGGATITLGLGQVTERAVVRHGVIQVAPVMRLSLTFDHRVIDGAEAADVLAEIRNAIESWSGDEATAGCQPVHRTESPAEGKEPR